MNNNTLMRIDGAVMSAEEAIKKGLCFIVAGQVLQYKHYNKSTWRLDKDNPKFFNEDERLPKISREVITSSIRNLIENSNYYTIEYRLSKKYKLFTKDGCSYDRFWSGSIPKI